MADLRVTGCASPVRSVRETAMGRYVICGPACSKKCSGPDSMSGDACAFSGIEALSKGQFIIGVDDQWMLASVTEEGLFDEGFKNGCAGRGPKRGQCAEPRRCGKFSHGPSKGL